MPENSQDWRVDRIALIAQSAVSIGSSGPCCWLLAALRSAARSACALGPNGTMARLCFLIFVTAVAAMPPQARTVTTLSATASQPLLFVDDTVLSSRSASLELRAHPPDAGPLVLWPTEPWESWAVFASNSVVQLHPGDANYTEATSVRMYYDCVQIGTSGHWGQIGAERSCVAVSADGITWQKPQLDIVRYQGQPSNILTGCAGPAVFVDRRPGVLPSQRWKMLCSNTVWAGPDGWHFQPMFAPGHKTITHKDDTMDIGSYDVQLGRYVIYVRRDVPVLGKSPSVHRRIGRCETDDLSVRDLDPCALSLEHL
jgi:hypothetical protein